MDNVKKYTVEEPFLSIGCGLGEAPFWEESTNTLRFVDIVKEKVHVVDLNKGASSHVEVPLDISVGTTADLEGEQASSKFAFGGKHGYGIFDRQTGSYHYIKRYWEGESDQAEKEKTMRGNDGGVDSHGRFWVGTMCDPMVKSPTDIGVVFRLDPDLTLHKMIENVSIPNGISWSRDDKTMYIADSPSKNVYAYDYDASSGSISNKRVFFHVDHEDGVPDGHAWDEEGCLWQCIFGCGKVVRLNPEGKVVAEVLLPTRCVTCPALVGEDLFITSAEEEAPEKFPDSVKFQGAIFRVHVGVKGEKLHRFKQQ
ncbi:hypothetical protein FKW77_001357 [Venturia effusa]|uniref:SMP-30/Gluconolactonase/LRE-like region domain-containing protein n=1 Tax=Venturia effusa TaxID=50376 RepID=A0A517KZ14_9PEZI|nr:hypothetical protein FKW77_001357 [Venturia effusa]